jgi:hypothetical protein
MQEFTVDAPAVVRNDTNPRNGRRNYTRVRDHWIVCDASEIAALAESRVTPQRKAHISGEWFGGHRWHDAIKAAQIGDNAAVAKSERYLSEMAAYMPESARRAYIDDVAGATPNVQAFIAGHPLNMRRRIVTKDEYAPLCIVYDPTCSSSIPAEKMTQRGIAVLALVRALAGVRPVELYVAGGLDWDHGIEGMGADWGAWIMVRIETAPLDIARAAHYMTHASFPRGILYSILEGAPTKASGGWPYGSHRVSIKNFEAIAKQALPHAQDVLAIPGVINSDPLLDNPRLWLGATMRRLMGEQEAA